MKLCVQMDYAFMESLKKLSQCISAMSERSQPSPPKIGNKYYSKQQSLWVFLLLDQDFFSYDYYSSHTWMWYYPRSSPSKKTLIYGSNY